MKTTEEIKIIEIELILSGHDYFDARFVYEYINELFIENWREREKMQSQEPFCLLNCMENILRHMCAVSDAQDGTPYGQSTIKINSIFLEKYKRASQWLKSLEKVKMEFNLSSIK